MLPTYRTLSVCLLAALSTSIASAQTTPRQDANAEADAAVSAGVEVEGEEDLSYEEERDAAINDAAAERDARTNAERNAGGEATVQTDLGGNGIVRGVDHSDGEPMPHNQPLAGSAGDDDDEGVDPLPMDVAIDAGVGSTLAYASQSVLEIGGAIEFSNQSNTTQLGLTPFIGYFIVDGLQLSLLARFNLIHISADDDDPNSESQTDARFAILFEPSYHLAVTNNFFAFVGLGVGASFARDPKADFIFRPRLGTDITIGRSAIFKPALYMDIGANDGYAGMGVEAAFSAMW